MTTFLYLFFAVIGIVLMVHALFEFFDNWNIDVLMVRWLIGGGLLVVSRFFYDRSMKQKSSRFEEDE